MIIHQVPMIIDPENRTKMAISIVLLDVLGCYTVCLFSSPAATHSRELSLKTRKTLPRFENGNGQILRGFTSARRGRGQRQGDTK